MPEQSCDLIRASDWRTLYVAWATWALYTFVQIPSLRVREKGLGTRLGLNNVHIIADPIQLTYHAYDHDGTKQPFTVANLKGNKVNQVLIQKFCMEGG